MIVSDVQIKSDTCETATEIGTHEVSVGETSQNNTESIIIQTTIAPSTIENRDGDVVGVFNMDNIFLSLHVIFSLKVTNAHV